MATARDLAIIILAVETIIIGALLVFLIFQMQALVRLLREQIQPILDSLNKTASTVRGTTTFVSDTVVSPVVRTAGLISAVRRVIDVLIRRKTE
jgi:hypothetical protein